MNTKDTFVIEGLGGKRTLKGSVTINGAKNAALKAMAATILFDGPVKLENVPDNSDIQTLTEIMRKFGAKVDLSSGNTLVIDTTSINSTDINAELAKNMRSSVVLTGPLLARFGKATFPAPGGCVIGARPIDLFLSGYESLGATVKETETLYSISAVGLRGTEITFKKISVGATETLMMAAVLAHGTTVLKNCAREPEIVNVAEWLNQCGAKIRGAGTPTMTIEGTNGKLLSPSVPYVTIPDRITTGSFLILGALCTEELTIKNCRPDHLVSLTDLLAEAGVEMKIGADSITVTNSPSSLKTYTSIAKVHTQEYPGFSTDLQSPLVTFLTQTAGQSAVFETIFEGRFKYIEDLIKLGADITIMNPREILVKGPTPFRQLPDAEELKAHDIRAGFAVVLGALIGKGKFIVNNVQLIDRGYEKLEEVLSELGADIKRVSR